MKASKTAGKRPVLQPTPAAGQRYRWDGGDGKREFMIVDIKETSREIWICRAVDMLNETVTEIGMRRRDRFNGWHLVSPLGTSLNERAQCGCGDSYCHDCAGGR